MRYCKLFVAIVLLLGSVGLRADTVAFNFSGTMFSEAFNGSITTPVAFTGAFTFDSSATNEAADPVNEGSYTSTGATFGTHIDDFGFGAFNAMSFINIGVLAAGSSYTVLSSDSGTTCVFGSLCITLQFFGANVSTVAQPGTPPTFSFATIDITDQENFEYQGTVSTLDAPQPAPPPPSVPEPATLTLFGCGIAGLGTVLRSGRRNSVNKGEEL